MAEYLVHGSDLTTVAEAIRQKGGTTAPLQFPDGFVSAVEAIQTGSTTAAEDNMRKHVEGRLTELVDSNITAVNTSYVFYQNNTLTLVDLPNAEGECKDHAFYNASQLSTCRMPKITSVGSACFMYTKLVDTDFSALETIQAEAFRSCLNLTRLDLPSLKEIKGHSCFYGCLKLATLILRSSTMVTIENTNTFNSTPIVSGTGYIYVPAALISTYQADSIWSNFANQFRAIEDYPDI